MFRNYLKTAVRNLLRNKSFSLINLSGLASGIACSLLIFLWIYDEYSVDGFHSNSAGLYSVYERQFYGDKVDAFHSTPGVLGDELKRVFPEVQYACGFAWINERTFEVAEKNIKARGTYASADFFTMFSYPLLQGTPQTALDRVSDIAISRNLAENLFGSAEKAMQKTVRFEDTRDFIVTAVFENTGRRSSEKFDYLINWHAFLEDNPWLKDWNININSGPRTYIMLRSGTNAAAFENRISNFLDSYFEEQRTGFRIELGIQRFADIYLHGQFKNGQVSGGRIEYVRLFSIIAIFILLVACINFMNLTTARFMKRAKEIGVRKVAGALRFSLIKQFLGEALLLAFLAAIFAVIIAYLLLPAFNELAQKQITFPLSAWYFWICLLMLTLFTGLIAGSYPALFLSALNPVKVLKGQFRAGPRAIMLRKGLVVFQFALSIILIMGTIVVAQQINYIKTKNLGYSKANVLSIPLEGNLLNQYNYRIFKQEALNKPGIDAVTRITQVPVNVDAGTSDVEWQNKSPQEKYLFIWAAVGYDFVKTMNLQMLDGRDFSRDHPTDSTGYIINESALKQINYKDPIGKPIYFWGQKGTIVGVVKDFHFHSLHDPIRPLILKLNENEVWGNALVRVEPGKTEEAIKNLSALSNELNPKFPFVYHFLDEDFQNLYKSEQVIRKLSACFAILAVLICCLGLLGLAMFAIVQRTKEIGIRKVMGAGPFTLLTWLTKDFLMPVFLAIAIAAPVGWWAMQNWLMNFAYRITINGWVIVLTGSIVVLIALLTISFQVIRAVIAKPAGALRSE